MKLFRLPARTLKIGCALDFQVRRLLQAVDQQRRLAADRQRENAFPAPVKHVVEKLRRGPRAEEHAQAPAAGHVLLHRRDGRGVQPLDVQQVDGPEAVQDVEAEEAGLLDPRLDAGDHRPAGSSAAAEVGRVAGLGVAVDQQHRQTGGEIDRAPALVVLDDRVALQPGLDAVRAGGGKVDGESRLDRLARRDLARLDRGQGLVVGLDHHRHVADRGRAEVRHGDLHEQRHPGRPRAAAGTQVADRQVGVLRLHAVDQVDLDPRGAEPGQAAAQLARLVPLPRAEVGQQVEHAALVLRLLQVLPDGLHGRQRTGGRERGLQSAQQAAQPAEKIGVDRLLDEVGAAVAGRADGLRVTQEREGLRLDLAGSQGGDPRDHRLGLGHRAGVVPAVGHREAVVQEHEVVGLAAAQPAAELIVQHGPGHGQHDQRHGGHPQQQEQQLLEQDPGAVLLLADQQELHGRPADAAVAHHVDQVDQHGQTGGQQAPEQQCMVERGHQRKWSVASG